MQPASASAGSAAAAERILPLQQVTRALSRQGRGPAGRGAVGAGRRVRGQLDAVHDPGPWAAVAAQRQRSRRYVTAAWAIEAREHRVSRQPVGADADRDGVVAGVPGRRLRRGLGRQPLDGAHDERGRDPATARPRRRRTGSSPASDRGRPGTARGPARGLARTAPRSRPGRLGGRAARGAGPPRPAAAAPR